MYKGGDNIIKIACISYNKTSLINLTHPEITVDYFDNIGNINYENYVIILILNDQKNVNVIKCLEYVRSKFDKIIYIIDYNYDESIVREAFKNKVNDYFTFPIKNEYLIQKIISDTINFEDGKLDYYKFDNLVVDFNAMEALIDDTDIKLTKIEYKLLKILVKNVNVAVTKNDIIKDIWGYDTDDYRTLETHVKTLRKKLGKYKKNIITIWSFGYSFVEKI